MTTATPSTSGSPSLIEIDTLIERPIITIDKEPYEITAPDELTIVESAAVGRLGRRLDRLMKKETLDQEGERELARTLGKLAAIIMRPVPADVRQGLNEAQTLAVIEVFTLLLLARKAKLAGGTMLKTVGAQVLTAMTNPSGTDGETPSPASSGSTAATRGAG